MTTTKYYTFALCITQAFLEVGAGIDGKTVTIIGVSSVVVVLIIISVLICWCCCNDEIDSLIEDNHRHIPGETTPLVDPQPLQKTISRSLSGSRCVIKNVNKSEMVASFQRHSQDTQRPLVKHRAFLRDRMDVDFGLLEVLLGSEILSYEALQGIKSRRPFQERNGTLIDYILKQNCDQRLSPALEETHQSHIANFLEADGVYSNAFDGVWPLSATIVRAMDANRQSLLDLIDPTELVNELLAENVISRRHREAIASKATCYERNETLLDIMRRLSLRDYSKAMGCFHATKQSHIVPSLAEAGRIVRVHANLRGVKEVLETEKELVDKITSLLRNQTTSYVNYILESVHLRLIGVTVGHSVVCHFHCPVEGDQKNLEERLQSQELEKSLEMVFNAALPERHIAGVAITSVDNQSAGLEMRTVPSDSSVGSLKKSDSRSSYTADDIETYVLYSILEKDLPVQHREWMSRRSTKRH